MQIDPIDNSIRTAHLLHKLIEQPDTKQCFFCQVEEDGTWAPHIFMYCSQSKNIAEQVSRDQWMYRTQEEFSEEFEREYWYYIQ